MKKSRIVFASTAALALLLAGCGSQQSNSNTNNSGTPKTTKVASSHQQDHIVGSFKDDKDGAAITLNADGTGQYVYADNDEPDTNDQLTWKRDGNSYTITLKDSNVTSPLTAKLSGQQLTLTGDSDWNTETFTKVKGKLDLSKFLSDAHGGQATNGSNDQQTSGGQNDSNGSDAGNTKNFTDSSNGAHHHVVMSGNDDGEGHQMGVDYETDPDGSHHVFQYTDGMN